MIDSDGISILNYIDAEYPNTGWNFPVKSIAISVPHIGDYTVYNNNIKQQGTKDGVTSDLFSVVTGWNVWGNVENKPTYYVAWRTQNGSVNLEYDSNLYAGDKPSYDGPTPTKAADAQYTYTFAGWATEPYKESGTAAEDLPPITGNMGYYAAFSKTLNKYNVTWKSQDGETILETDNVDYGVAPSYDGTAPTKEGDAQYTYILAGWATTTNAESGTPVGSLPKVSGETTYYAAFSKTVNKYTVTWKSQDGGTILETDNSVDYGVKPTYDGAAPTKEADTLYIYIFAGWATSPNEESGTVAGSLPTVNGNTTYYAAFSKTERKYSVTWKSQNGTDTLETDDNLLYGAVPSYDGATPTKAVDAQYTYTFAGWATSPNAESGTAAGSLPTVSGDTIYYAAFSKTVNKYSVIWKYQDGTTTLETDAGVDYGTAPSYEGTTPTKAADPQYTYTFAGWATTANAESGITIESLPNVSGDTIYYAAFSKTLRSYSVIWKSQDGTTILETDANVNYGTAPSYDGAIPTKAANAQYTYTFAGWATSANAESGTIVGSLPTVSGDTIYYAAFSKTVNQYNVIWKSQDGTTTLETDANVNYGTAPSYGGTTLTKAADAQYTYTFAGWTTSANAESGTAVGSLPPVSGDTIYYAAFSKIVNKYSIIWKSQDGATTLETDANVNYGTAPSYDGATPTKAADALYTYTFVGWATSANAESGTAAVSLPNVSGDTVYYAAFSKAVRKYSVTWKSQDGMTTLEADSDLSLGIAPSYDGEEPLKAADAQYTYTFAGWATSSNEESGTAAGSLPTVSGDTTYYAAFSKTINQYNVIWKSQDGATTLEIDSNVNYGTAPSFDGTVPTKEADEQYTYTFAGWATSANAESGTIVGSLPSVSRETTYYAAFSRVSIIPPGNSGPGSNTAPPTKPEGIIQMDMVREEGSPAATINNSGDNLKASVFTDEEKEKLASGENAKVILKVTSANDSVSEAEKKMIEEKLEANQQNVAEVSILYVDISLYKQIGNGQETKVTQTGNKISISIEIPESMRSTENGVERIYRAVRIHNGVADILEGTYDPVTHLFTFETDRFSTYALTYQDTKVASDDTTDTIKDKITVYNDFHHLQLTAKAGKTTQTLTFKKADDVDGYLIYGAKCGEKMKLLADLPADITSYKVSKLKQGTNYKFQVKAYRMIDGEQLIVMTSKTIHTITESKTYGNPTKVTTSKSSVTLAVGKSKTVIGQVVLPEGKKLKEHATAIRYESSNKKIATVNSKGKITAKAKGTCYVYAYAQNGVYKRIKVTVK